jgi:hypothetical protein
VETDIGGHDLLVSMFVDFFFSRFTDSLLDLGDFFVVFCFPVRSFGQSSLFHSPVWSWWAFEGHPLTNPALKYSNECFICCKSRSSRSGKTLFPW